MGKPGCPQPIGDIALCACGAGVADNKKMPTTIQGDFGGYLLRTEPFAGWSQNTHKTLARDSALMEFAAGSVLQQAGTPAKAAYLVFSGTVELATPVAAGHRHCVGFIHPGSLVGAPFMLNPDSGTQDWTAATRVKAWRIPRDTFVSCFWSDLDMASTVVMNMTAWLRRLADAAAHWVHLEAHGRVAYALLMVTRGSLGRGLEAGESLRITHEKLGDMTGLTRQSVGAALRALRDADLVPCRAGKSS
jgi:CRP-like cAMP-binding protein